MKLASKNVVHTGHDDSQSLTDRPEWMAPNKAAAYIDGSISTLAKLRLRGGGPVFCRIGHAVRYRRADLDAWLLSTSRRSTSDTGAE